MSDCVLDVKNLSVEIPLAGGVLHAVDEKPDTLLLPKKITRDLTLK